MDKTEMMLQELEGLKNTVSRDYGRRLGAMREEGSEETEMCPSCGADISVGETICPKCGANLDKAAEEADEEQADRRDTFDEGLARR